MLTHGKLNTQEQLLVKVNNAYTCSQQVQGWCRKTAHSPWYGCVRTYRVNRVNDRSLQWHHNEWQRVSNHRQLVGLFDCLFGLTAKKTSKLVPPTLCEGIPLVNRGFPSQRPSNAESVSMTWRHHEMFWPCFCIFLPDDAFPVTTVATLIFLRCYWKEQHTWRELHNMNIILYFFLLKCIRNKELFSRAGQ